MKPKSLLTVCRDVTRVEDAEITRLEEMAKGQLAYNHPLKMGTAARQNKLGEHNLAVIKKFRELRETIVLGKALTVASKEYT